MILFFETPSRNVIATEVDHQLNPEEISKLCWLFGGARLNEERELQGRFVGPRREMVTPWSTNAVEITQNMGLRGIQRIEEFVPEQGAEGEAPFDPMLQRRYDGLGQEVFTVDMQPQPILHVADLEAYNEQEGLALSPEEIAYLKQVEQDMGRPLTDSEVFGFAQVNSEHCRHKIFGGQFVIDGEEKEASLFQMIKKTTAEHPYMILSAYKDNVAFTEGPRVEQFAPQDQSKPDWFRVTPIDSVISLKAETHNFPTTVEPFNGAATGTGGEIRDRMGGGTGSWPIAGTAVYMTSYPRVTAPLSDPEGTAIADKPSASSADQPLSVGVGGLLPWEELLPVRKWLYQTPEQILIKASNGASDFGNKFGQPLICGSVLTFEMAPRGTNAGEAPSGATGEASATPLYAYDKVIMLAGGVGYGKKRDCLKKEPQKGNKVVVVGGDNYRIGLGGGSVSSVDTGRYAGAVELNAIQRANPEMQKRAYNLVRALVEADDNPVVSIHDHGAAGHLNCLSELVEECGGEIDMTQLPVGDKTLSAKEIIANESQERMGLLIDEKHIDHVRRIAERERAPLYVVGETTGDAHFSFRQADGVKPFDMDVAQMFGHSPKTVMVDRTVERHYAPVEYTLDGAETLQRYIEGVLQLEAVACKDWLTNKVDRSVTGKIARQQCQGQVQLPLSDCGVVALDYRGRRGIATALGHAPQAGLISAEAGSILSVAEALTNIVWAPLADGLDSVSLSVNWMWPCRSQEGEDARLYRAVETLSRFCQGIGVNVPTGKDSLSMTQKYPDGTKVIAPGTVIVSAGAEVSDIRKVVSPVLVNDKNTNIYHIDFSFQQQKLGGSAFAQSLGQLGDDVAYADADEKMRFYCEYFRDTFNAVQEMVRRGWILAGHDISAGGLVTALLEMCFANTTGGLRINLSGFEGDDLARNLFAENPGIIVQVAQKNAREMEKFLDSEGVGFMKIGFPTPAERTLVVRKGDAVQSFDIDHLRDVWYRKSYLLDRDQSRNGCAEARYRNYKRQPLEMVAPRGFTGQLAQYGLHYERKAVSPKHPKAAIIREKGTNGDREMAYSLYLAGFDVKDVTMTDLISGRETLDEIQMIVFCGGFSNSDVLGSAKGWAGAFLFNPKAKEALDRFYARPDTLSLGICNGCQLMVELGLVGRLPGKQEGEALPAGANSPATVRMLHNDSRKFESGFITLAIPENKSVMFGSLSGTKLGIWVAHGEGKFSLPEGEACYNVIAKYNHAEYPANPNGSDYAVAGICSADGRHLAMMPHLERAIFPWQCAWYPASRCKDEVTPWIEAFVNARRWLEELGVKS